MRIFLDVVLAWGGGGGGWGTLHILVGTQVFEGKSYYIKKKKKHFLMLGPKIELYFFLIFGVLLFIF